MGGPELHFQSMRNGYVANTRAGILYLELSSCIDGSRANVVQYRWTNRSVPLILSFPTGPVRFVRLTRPNSRIYLKIMDERGRNAMLTIDKNVTDISCYCRKAAQDLIFNFVQPQRADKSVDFVSIVDTQNGPVLRNGTAP